MGILNCTRLLEKSVSFSLPMNLCIYRGVCIQFNVPS